MLNINFPEKGLGLVSPPYFVYDFSRKMVLILYSINWPNFIIWLPLLLDISGNGRLTIFVFIAGVCFSVCDVINFEINVILTSIKLILIKPFFWNICQDKYLNVLRTKRAFKVQWKPFFIIFHWSKIISDLRVCLSYYKRNISYFDSDGKIKI